jgi:hypothetical protein
MRRGAILSPTNEPGRAWPSQTAAAPPFVVFERWGTTNVSSGFSRPRQRVGICPSHPTNVALGGASSFVVVSAKFKIRSGPAPAAVGIELVCRALTDCSLHGKPTLPKKRGKGGATPILGIYERMGQPLGNFLPLPSVSSLANAFDRPSSIGI